MRQTTGFYLCVLNVIHVILGDLTTHPGHMKPFGSGGPFVQVPEVSEFPGPRDFFEMYVYKKVPLVVRGGAKQMAAFSKWTDDYLKGKHLCRLHIRAHCTYSMYSVRFLVLTFY